MTCPNLRTLLLGTGVAAMSAGAALADDILSENDSLVRSRFCVGSGCETEEGYIGHETLRLKQLNVGIDFTDTSTSAGVPTNDWRLFANDAFAGGAEYFALRDTDSGTNPLIVEADAPTSSLHVDDDGDIGFGTALPTSELHVVDDFQPSLLLEQTTIPYAWRIDADEDFFSLFDSSAGTLPFRIENAAPYNSLYMEDTGEIGLGTPIPEGKLHTKGNGVQLAYFESSDGGPVQVRFRTDSENRRFLAVNNANEVKTQIIFKDNEILFTGQTDSGANRWLTIGPNGILSQGGTCNVNPCDAVFDPAQFTVPPIEERAALMWEQRHLPAIGPTVANEPINLTEKTTGIIHELEIAHIYIAELHDRLAAETVRNDRLQARVSALEARIAEAE